VHTSIRFSSLHCGVCLAVLAAFSMLLHEPLLIPAIGASVYLVLSAPGTDVSAPKNVLVSHAIGATVGWLMLGVFGLHGVPGGLAHELTWTRIAAVAASLALTNGIVRFLKCSHPPSGATTMIVSIGGLPLARHILDFELAALLVVAYAVVVHRVSGVEYPLWRARSAA
jgi:CBS domain-containing membrane protein